jgi:integrase
MAISTREVKNKRDTSGKLTGKPGVVYDVNIKYTRDGKSKTYSKKGFPTRSIAAQYESDMRNKLCVVSYIPATAAQSKLTVKEYMAQWIEDYSKTNLKPSTYASYKSQMHGHIFPHIGDIPLSQVTPAMLDNMFSQLLQQGLSNRTVQYDHRIISVAFETARKYHYIESNPARDIITKFGKGNKTPEPYTVEQMRQLIDEAADSPLEMIIVLSGLYGLRRGEVIGLRWENVDLEKGIFHVVEQLPYGTS